MLCKAMFEKKVKKLRLEPRSFAAKNKESDF